MVTVRIDLRKAKAAKAGQKMIAQHLFDKGKSFIAAAVLLDQKKGSNDVVLHLICQGLEIIQKALLLAKDYGRFEPMLKKWRHDLVLAADQLQSAYGFNPIDESDRADLEEINVYYCQHLLRYSEIRNFIGGTQHLSGEKALRRAVSLLEIGDKCLM